MSSDAVVQLKEIPGWSFFGPRVQSSKTLQIVISLTDGNTPSLKQYIAKIRSSASSNLQPFKSPNGKPRGGDIRITVLKAVTQPPTPPEAINSLLEMSGADEIQEVSSERLTGSRAALRFLVTHYHALEAWTAFMSSASDPVMDLDGFFGTVKEDTAFSLVDGSFNVCSNKQKFFGEL
ncbi:hypothetical protein HDU67_009395 [Dinochytrium kinnereticum]|nr:hypothetical protein HDU67_009395 [Dinochytrium kinnereticum]